MNFTNNSYYPASSFCETELQFPLETAGDHHSPFARSEELLGPKAHQCGRAFDLPLCGRTPLATPSSSMPYTSVAPAHHPSSRPAVGICYNCAFRKGYFCACPNHRHLRLCWRNSGRIPPDRKFRPVGGNSRYHSSRRQSDPVHTRPVAPAQGDLRNSSWIDQVVETVRRVSSFIWRRGVTFGPAGTNLGQTMNSTSAAN